MKTGPIILVDDDPDDQHIVKELIAEIGRTNKLISFTASEEAYEYLASHLAEQPFIILCDINMPRLNGIDFKKKIDANPALKDKSIPFVFYSTAASRQTVMEAYELKIQGVFIKPYHVEKVKSTLRLIFDYWTDCKHPNS